MKETTMRKRFDRLCANLDGVIVTNNSFRVDGGYRFSYTWSPISLWYCNILYHFDKSISINHLNMIRKLFIDCDMYIDVLSMGMGCGTSLRIRFCEKHR